MAGEVAEVVAIVRADTGDYEREMRKADRTTRNVQKINQASDRANVDGANRTAAALGRARLGWLGVAGAIGTANALFNRGPLADALKQQRGVALDRIGDQLFRGTGLSDLSKATNKRLFDVARGLKATRNADPTGEGNLAIGATEQARQKVLGIGTTPYDRGFAEGSQGSALNRAGQTALGIAGIPLSLAGAAVGQTEGAIEGLERSRGRIVGGLGLGQGGGTERLLDRAGGGTMRVDVMLNTDQAMSVAVSNAFQDPEVQRALQRALQDQVRQNLAGALP